MIICDWCGASGKMMYDTLEQISKKPYDTKPIELCYDCYRKHEKAIAEAEYIATIEIKDKIIGENKK